jgi:hypothetical protein
MFQIEKNIPVPSKASLYPFRQMEIGDSFLVPADAITRARSALTAFRSANDNFKFATRTLDGGALRIWRVA